MEQRFDAFYTPSFQVAHISTGSLKCGFSLIVSIVINSLLFRLYQTDVENHKQCFFNRSISFPQLGIFLKVIYLRKVDNYDLYSSSTCHCTMRPDT